jgi:hypothetical protein
VGVVTGGFEVPAGWEDLGLAPEAVPEALLPERSKVPPPDDLVQTLAIVRACRPDCDPLDVRICADRAWRQFRVDWPRPDRPGAWTARLRAAEKRGHLRVTGTRDGYLTYRMTERGRLELETYEATHPRVLRD